MLKFFHFLRLKNLSQIYPIHTTCNSYEKCFTEANSVETHTLGMILGNLKFDENIHTEIENICTIHSISVLALGDGRITAASALRKDHIFASEV